MLLASHRGSAWLVLGLVGVVLAAGPASALEAGKLLPADTDVILTCNVRQFLADHRQTPVVREHLERWHQAVTKNTLDPTQDLDRITCAFKVGEAGSLVVLVEGRFNKDRLRAAVEQLARDNAWSFQVARRGALEVWQLPDAADGLYLSLLDSGTLAITGRQQGLDDLLVRSTGRDKGALPAGVQALLARGQKEHVALVVNSVGLLLDGSASILREVIARQLQKPGSLAGYAVEQMARALKPHADDLSAGGVGLSFGADKLRLQFDLLTGSPKTAGKLAALIGEGNFWTALALQAADDPLARQLAGVLRKERALARDERLTVEMRVPYPLVKEVGEGSGLVDFFGGEAAVGPPSSALGQTVVAAVSRQVTSIPLWGPPPGAAAVESVLDLAYRDGPGADRFRHRLDLFYPKGQKGYPVVVLVHGGGWTQGDNRCCGLYTSVGRFLAGQGIGAVLINYRLAPRTRHPDQVKDVARAVAWTREHVAEYGGDPRRLFLLGHSAGGHLVSLLATDESYLKAEGLTTADLKGVISASGVYRIPAGKVEVTLGGAGPTGAGVDRMLPLRGSGSLALGAVLPPLPTAVDVYGPVFGDDPGARRAAAPLSHVRRGLPPFLLLVAEKDLPTLAPMADEFHQALVRHGCDARLLRVDRRNHNSLLFTAISPADPAARAIVDFIREKDSGARER
jgi:acetyl esterase/lipase